MKRTLNLFCCLLIAATTLAQHQLYSYSDGHKWGLTNENLEVLAKPQFDEEFRFDWNLTYAFVKINKKWGTIDRQGKIVIPCKYDRLSSCQSTYIIARTGDLYGVLDAATAQFLIPAEYDQIKVVIVNGVPYFAVVNKGSNGFLNRDGKPVTINPDEIPVSENDGIVAPPVDDYPNPVSLGNGVFVKNLGNGNWKITKEKNSVILETHELNGYSSIELLRVGSNLPKLFETLKAVKNGKTGIIEKDGKVLVPFEYDKIEGHLNWFITILNGKKGVLRSDLTLLKKPVLKEVDYRNSYDTFLVTMFSGERGEMNSKTGRIYIPGVKE